VLKGLTFFGGSLCCGWDSEHSHGSLTWAGGDPLSLSLSLFSYSFSQKDQLGIIGFVHLKTKGGLCTHTVHNIMLIAGG